MFNTRIARGCLLLDLARGEEKLRGNSGSTTAWWWSSWFFGRALLRSTEEEEEELEGEGCARGKGCSPHAPPHHNIGVEGAGFLPSKSIGALAKVGGKKSHHFLPHRLLYIPPF